MADFQVSFRDAVWYANSAPIAGGNKLVPKPILNSGRQNVNSTGSRPDKYTIPGIIAERSGLPSVSYEVLKTRFLRAVRDDSVGVLFHPVLGRVDNAYAMSFTFDEVILSRTRIANVSVTFELGSERGISTGPPVLGGLEETVEELNDKAEGALTRLYKATTKFAGNFKDGVAKLNEYVKKAKDATDPLTQVADKINGFSRELQSITENVSGLVSAPQDLSKAIRTNVQSMNALFATPALVFDVMTRMFSFGDLDIALSQDTAGGREKQKNRDLLNAQVRSITLGEAYIAAIEMDIGSVEELDDITRILENQYQKLQDEDIWEPDVQIAMEGVRVKYLELADALRALKPRQVEFKTAVRPAGLLAYLLYEDLDRAPEITALNKVAESSFVEGTITVLSS